jgi:hypothetical protein
VISDEEPTGAVATALADTLRSFSSAPVERVETGSFEHMEQLFARTEASTHLVIVGLNALSRADWETLDRARSRLERRGSVLLVLGSDAAGLFFTVAPHLANWAELWKLPSGKLQMSASEVEDRLEELRAESGLSDAELIAKAESGTLPNEPWAAEWLVLLGKSDLIGQP